MIPRPPFCRRSLLVTFLTTLLVLALAVSASADVIAPPHPTLLIVEPIEGSNVVFQRIAPAGQGTVDQGRISIQLRVFNPGPEVLVVDRVEILGQVVSFFDDFPQPPIGPGDRWWFQNCLCDGSMPRIIDAPFPATAKVEVFFDGGQPSLSKTVSLAVHDNDDAPLSFISRLDDLQGGKVWSSSSHHPFGHQVFALDIGVRSWNGSDWSGLYPDANKYEKESFLVYGMPIYAMADGTVCSALGDQTEPKLVGCGTCGTESPSTGNYSKGGNHIFVQTGDEISLYAHLQPNSIPSEYLTPGAVVKRGAYLGKVGFSGNSSGPHVHLHVKKEPDGGAGPQDCDKGAFRPMMFDDVSSLTVGEAKALAQNGTLTVGQWTGLSQHSFSHPTGLLYPSSVGLNLCTNCSDSRKYLGVWGESSEIDLRVKVRTWEAFTHKWEDLANDNFFLTEVDVVEENGNEYFIGLYRRGFEVQGLLSLSHWAGGFGPAVAELASEGLHLIDVDIVDRGGYLQWVGVFQKGAEAHVTRDLEDYGAFAAEWNQLAIDGLALIDLEIYEDQGQQRFFGIFAPDADALSQKLYGLADWATFRSEAATFADEGFHLVDVETRKVGNDRQYFGIFRPGVGTFSLVESWDLFQQTDEKMRNKGFDGEPFFRLIDVHVLE